MNKLNIYKTKTINFLRKYSLNIFMAIVAINSYSISSTLKENRNILNENVKLLRYKEICARYYTFYSSGGHNRGRYKNKKRVPTSHSFNRLLYNF